MGGRHKPWSDLDPVVERAEPLPLALAAALAEAFDGAALPFKVDIVDRHLIDGPFGETIVATRVDLAGATPLL